MNKTKSENVSDTSLSQKYSVLLKYKVLVYILMVAITIGYLSMYGYEDGDIMIVIYTIITYVITMFSLFCLTKMIDFLFDLDKKTDNNV